VKAERYGAVHGLAHCLDCGWETQSYKNAQALASRHAEAHGHRVEGEVAYCYVYAGTASSLSKRRRKGE
jgi:hypothetical protein